MSGLVDAVEKANQERRTGIPPRPANSLAPFFAASAVFLAMTAGVIALYLHQESKAAELQAKLSLAEASLTALTREKQSLEAKQIELEERVTAAKEEQRVRIDELLGRAKVLQYEKETLDADVSAKEKRISELDAQVLRQEEREAELMSLIEQAKQQLADQKAAAAAAAAQAAQAARAAQEAVDAAADSPESAEVSTPAEQT